MNEDFRPKPEDVLASLDGNVHSQGVKIGHRAWLDLGSKEWDGTPDSVKAAAWQAAKVTGWQEETLKALMVDGYGHITDTTISMAISLLKSWESEYPLDVENVYETIDASNVPIRDGTSKTEKNTFVPLDNINDLVDDGGSVSDT